MSAPAAAAPSPPSPTPRLPGSIRIVKVVVNAGVGESGEPRSKAEKVLQMITHAKPIATRSKATNRDFGIRLGQEIGVKVTLRGEVAREFLDRAFEARDRQFDPESIDRTGSFSFGIGDYTDFPGMKYDPQIGIHGMDICVELGRPGFRIRDRQRAARALPKRLRVTPAETRQFLADQFRLTFLE